jgi:hypothetical protein
MIPNSKWTIIQKKGMAKANLIKQGFTMNNTIADAKGRSITKMQSMAISSNRNEY